MKARIDEPVHGSSRQLEREPDGESRDPRVQHEHERRDAGVAPAEEDRDRDQRTELADRADRAGARPNGVRSSPASRRIGRIVPSAVEHRAMPMMTASSPGAISQPTATPTARLMSHPKTRIAAGPAAEDGELDLGPRDEEQHREAELRQRRDERREAPPSRAARPDQDAEQELEHDDRHPHPAPEPARQQRREHGEERDDQQRRLELVHGLTLAIGAVGVDAIAARLARVQVSERVRARSARHRRPSRPHARGMPHPSCSSSSRRSSHCPPSSASASSRSRSARRSSMRSRRRSPRSRDFASFSSILPSSRVGLPGRALGFAQAPSALPCAPAARPGRRGSARARRHAGQAAADGVRDVDRLEARSPRAGGPGARS